MMARLAIRDAAPLGDPAQANKALIQRMFQDLFANDSFDEEILHRYFSTRFVQQADGATLDFDGLVDHVRELKKAVTGLRFTFEHMVAEGNKVMDIHRVEGEKRAGGTFAAKLFSLWIVEDGKIVLCNELSYLERGAIAT